MIVFNAVAVLSIFGSSSAMSSINLENHGGEFHAHSKAGRDLIASSRLVNNPSHSLSSSERTLDGEYYEDEDDYLGIYSIKLLDCHTINQWNEDGEGGDGDETSDSIVASNLVRFRLCPSSSCQDKTSTGCSSKYGDYLVDVNSFVYSYLSAQDSSDDDSFNAINYAQCAAYNDYYLGPSCSSDGKSILLAGIKYLQKDGTISSSSTRRSKGASLVIGFLSFGSFLPAFYVHYLSTSKLVAFLLFH